MKALMDAIKEHLQNDSNLSYVNDNSIIITEDENLIPFTIAFPAITIKDGVIQNRQMLNKNYLMTAQVKITVVQRSLKNEEAITGTYGILNMAGDVITSLIDEKFDLAGFQNAFPVAEEPSQVFFEEAAMIQKKTIIFEYRVHKIWT